MPRRVPPPGDLSTARTFTQYSLNLLNAGNQSDGTTRIKDLEVEWDTAPAELKPQDTTTWTVLDGMIDTEQPEPEPEPEPRAGGAHRAAHRARLAPATGTLHPRRGDDHRAGIGP